MVAGGWDVIGGLPTHLAESVEGGEVGGMYLRWVVSVLFSVFSPL